MITPELVKNRESKKVAVQCAICKIGAGSSMKIVKSGSNFGVVCMECLDAFSKKDLELLYNIFVAFGGYFGKYVLSIIFFTYVLNISNRIPLFVSEIPSGKICPPHQQWEFLLLIKRAFNPFANLFAIYNSQENRLFLDELFKYLL